MTDNEREELAYDIANHYVTNTSQAGVIAMAIDRIMDLLLKKGDDELLEMVPPSLVEVPTKTKKKRNKGKPQGF